MEESRLEYSGARTAERSSSGSPYKSAVTQNIEDETVRALKEYIDLEGKLERAKTNLALRYDFNLFDAFRIFDSYSSGYFVLSDFRLALQDLGIFATYEELSLFFTRYDTDKDGRIRFSEFAEAFLPRDSLSASRLNGRGSNHVRPPFYPSRDSCFGAPTSFEFKDLLRTHFRVELAAEDLRQRLRRVPLFSGYEAYKTCDIYNDGVVTKNEIKRLFDLRGIYVNNEDVNGLMEKFDKDRDGRISYSEFMDEI